MTDFTAYLRLGVDSRDAEKAAKDLDKMTASANKADAASERLSESSSKVNTSFSKFGSNAGRAGIQVQQLVGQIQGGQSAFIAISQQAADLGIVLGAPLLGVITSLAAVAGGVLFSSLIQSSKALDDMAKTTRELVKELTYLNDAQQKIVNSGLAISIDDQRGKYDELSKAIVDQQKKIDLLNSSSSNLVLNYGNVKTRAEALKEATRLLVAQQQEQILVQRQIADLQDPSGSLKKIKALSDEVALIGVTGKAYYELKAAQEGITGESVKEYVALGLLTDQKKKDLRATEESAKAAESLSKSQAKTLKDLNEQLAKESFLLGNTNKEVAIRYDLKTKLNGATEKEASGLIAAAKALDNYARANQEAKDHAALMGDTVDEINKSFDELNKSNLDRISNDITVFTEKVTDGQKKIDDAAKKSAESLQESITDSIFRGFEDGKGIAENFADTLKNTFKTLVLKPSIDIATEQLSKTLGSILGSAGTKGPDGKTSGATGLIGLAGPYAAVAVAVAAAVSSFNKEQEKKFEKLTAAYRQGSQATGTLLAAANKKSESISNSIASLGDTASSTLDVNYGMYQALLDIRTGISGAAAGFARQGIATGDFSQFESTRINRSPLKGLSDELNNFAGSILGDQVGAFLDSLTSKISSFIANKKTKVIDSGIKIMGTSLADILAEGTVEAFSYATIKTTRKVFGLTTSIKVKEQLDNLDNIFETQFAGIFKSAGAALEEASKTFGVNLDTSKLVVTTSNLSLKGLTGDALTKEIENFFSATLDNWAGVLTYGTDVLTKYQQVGEGAFETVARLSTQTNTFASYAEKLNFNFAAIGLTAIDTVQNIAKLSGGFDQLGSSLSAYYQNFFSDSERTAAGLSQIGEKLKTIGVDAVPSTREEFRKLVEAIDLTTAAGQEQFATLISLSGAFAQLVPATKDAVQTTEDLAVAHQKYVESLKDSASSALDGLSKSISAEKERINLIVSNASAAKSALDSAIENEKEKLKSVADQKISAINAQADAEKTAQEAINKARIDSLKEQQSAVADSIKTMTSLVDNINGTIYDMAVNSDALTASRRRAAQFEIDTTIANVRAGRGAGDISGALSTLRQNPAQLYSSAKELAYATAVTQNKLAELAKLTGANITDSQKQLDILNAQLANSESFTAVASAKYDQMISVAQGQYDADIASLDAMKSNAQSQFDKLTGIDTTVLGLNEAFKKYNESLLAADFENAQAQNAKLDDQLAKSEAQLNALLGIDNSVLSLKDSVDKFLAAISVLNKEVNKDNLDALNAVAAQIQNLRDEQRAQSLKQVAAMETTARNTTSLVIDSVPA